jgi:hypothetical protein
MLKITEQRSPEENSVSLTLEGRLSGPWVEELDACCQRLSLSHGCCVMIDLTGVTFINADGKALLASLWRQGAELRASGCLTKCIVEEITRLDRSDPSKKNCSSIH